MNALATRIITRLGEDLSLAAEVGTDAHYALADDRIEVREYSADGQLGSVLGYLHFSPEPRGSSVQWAPTGNLIDGVPSTILRLLATGATTYGYGGGPGSTMMFGTSSGADITVEPTQWVTRYPDGTVSVTDTQPLDADAVEQLDQGTVLRALEAANRMPLGSTKPGAWTTESLDAMRRALLATTSPF